MPTKNYFTGMAGVYFVASELSSRGYIAAVTTGNAPGVDIIASTPDLKKTFNIQVKTNSVDGTQSFWLINEKSKKLVSPNHVYVFVNMKEKSNHDIYIVKSKTVADKMYIGKDGTWPSFYRDKKYKEKWDLLK